MKLESIKRDIIKGIDLNWPTIYIIRYVYVELGKYLSKDTDFFFSVDNKLEKHNISIDELKNIYNSDFGRNNQIICYSGCKILKSIYDTLGIKSDIIKSKLVRSIDRDGEVLNIYHWLLVAYDENNNGYFLSLSPDLAYIQEGMKTHHFAMNIPKVRLLTNNNIENVYEGDEIKPTLLSDEEFRIMDAEIGYMNNYYKYDKENHKTKTWHRQYNDTSFALLKDNVINIKDYYKVLSWNTDLYKDLYEFVGLDGNYISFFDTYLKDLSEGDKNAWVFLLCYKITLKLKEKTLADININDFSNTNWDYNNWIKKTCSMLKNYILDGNMDSKYDINDDFDYSKWSKLIKKDYPYNFYDYDSILAILDKVNTLVNIVKYNISGNFNELLSSLCFHFINEDFILKEDDKNTYIKNSYIAHKFSTLFPKIFSANEIITDFNKREYSEQIVIIKEIMEIMFPELNKSNSYSEKYNDNYLAVFNRIQVYTIKNRKNGNYELLFNVIGDNKSGDYFYHYDLKNNTFGAANYLNIYLNNIIVSSRFKERVEELDDIEIDTIKKR